MTKTNIVKVNGMTVDLQKLENMFGAVLVNGKKYTLTSCPSTFKPIEFGAEVVTVVTATDEELVTFEVTWEKGQVKVEESNAGAVELFAHSERP